MNFSLSLSHTYTHTVILGIFGGFGAGILYPSWIPEWMLKFLYDLYNYVTYPLNQL